MAQPAPPRHSVAPIAVRLGLITPQQLNAARAAQAKAPGKSLDDILVEQKALTSDQVRTLLKESTRVATPVPAGLPAARPRPRPAALAVAGGREETRKTWILAGVIAMVPIVAIVLYLAFKGQPETPADDPPITVKTPPPVGDKTPPKETPPKEQPGPKAHTLRIKATLRKLPGHSDIVTRWNAAADTINSMRDPEQYKPVLEDLTSLVKDSAGSEHAEDIRDGYKDVLEAVTKRGEQVFGFLADEVALLKAAGKFGDAIKAWEWFPGNLDLVGAYARKISEDQKAARGEAESYFGRSMGEIDALVRSGDLEKAHLLLERALEIGIDDLYAKAERRMTELTRLTDDAIKRKNEEELAEFERRKSAEKEAAKTAALYQVQYWKFVSERQFDGAKAFLAKQKAGATPEVIQAIAGMERVLDEIGAGFDLLAKILEGKTGRTVSLAFLENGRQQNRSFVLKGVRDGRITYSIEGRELSLPITDLHSSEIAKLAVAGPQADHDLLYGISKLLDGSFDAAHTQLSGAGPRAQGIVAFVENSTSFLQGTIPIMKERIARFVSEKQWELAIKEYTKLASLPAERKEALRGRARAHYLMNNFMDAVSDIESLFEMDDFAEPTVDLLNQTFKRSALIDKAIRMFEKANARVPENIAILKNLVELYMQIHAFDKAQETLTRAQKLRGGGMELAQLAHLVSVALEPAFPGRTFRAQFGRYDLETNVSQEYASKMARFMDRVYQSYIKVFPYKKNETLRFHLKLFSTEGEFFTYYKRSTGADPQGPHGKILAYYMSVTKELVGWNAEGIEETLQHEGLHQYFDYFIQDCPIWFNEGYASFFETSTADSVRFNEERHHTALWLYQGKQLPSMKDIFMMSGAVFRAKGALHYGSSWSVIYWFIKSGRKQILDRYFEALMEGKDQQQAFDAIFGPGKENIDEFDAKWRKAVNTENYDE